MVTSSGATLELLLAVPMDFPDAFPSVYLTQEQAQVVIPHLDHRRFLCTFDNAEAFPNADYPVEVVQRVVERAVRIWDDGISGANADDFQDELSAYWEDGLTERALSLVTINDISRTVFVTYLTKPWRGYRWLFSDNLRSAQEWLRRLGIAKFRTLPALYVVLPGIGIPPFPKTNAEMYRRLEVQAPAELAKIIEFLKSNPRPSTVLFSVPSGAGQSVEAWSHPAAVRPRHTHFGVRYEPAPIAGFRPGCCPPEVELLQGNASGPVTRIPVDRIDLERLFYRSAGRVPLGADKVNLVGCGSVGGFLADGLIRSGITQELRLVDEQVFGPENVQRHYCGAEWIGVGKADAVRQQLLRHYPFLSAHAWNENILDLLRARPDALCDARLTILALGSMATERAVNRLMHGGGSPLGEAVAFVWVEPHLLGGHVLYLGDPDAPGCFECLFDEAFRFRGRVVCESESLSRREAGCQTTYMPYGATDLIEYTAAAVRFLQQQIERDSKDNLVFTWVGNLEAAHVMKIQVRADLTPFSTFVRAVSPNSACRVCAT